MYKGKENYETAKHLMAGEECIVTGYGQSMTPILKSGQAVRCVPVTEETILKKNDIVLYYAKLQGIFICIRFLQSKVEGHFRFPTITDM